jgi:hypothetical protein
MGVPRQVGGNCADDGEHSPPLGFNRPCDRPPHHPFEPPTGLQGRAAGDGSCWAVRAACGLDGFLGVVSTGLSAGSAADASVASVVGVAASGVAAMSAAGVAERRDGGSGRLAGTAAGAAVDGIMAAGVVC